MAVSPVNNSNAVDTETKTRRGTKIVKPGSDMDKNAFLKILSAELANQNPDSNTDSTQYVAQMAQFTSLEQMQNLNTTMTMSSASQLVGKAVGLNVNDSNGNPYTGIVGAVSNNNGTIKLTVTVKDNGTIGDQEFNYSDVSDVFDVPTNTLSSVNSTMGFLSATSLIGKNVEVSDQDSNKKNYSGVVKGVSKVNGQINLTVLLPDGTTKDFNSGDLLKVSE